MPGGAGSQPSCQPAAHRCLRCPGEATAQPHTGVPAKGTPPQHPRSPRREEGLPRGCRHAPSKVGRGERVGLGRGTTRWPAGPAAVLRY